MTKPGFALSTASTESTEGVKVYVLYDHFGSFGLHGVFGKEMRQAGFRSELHPFRWTAPLNYVHRDHRKLIGIDSKRAFTGGSICQ